jgi:endoglucanase
MKGVGVSNGSINQLSLEFKKSKSSLPVHKFNKSYLESVLLKYLSFGSDNNVPMFIGEYSSINVNWLKDNGNLEQNAYGSLTYITDLTNLFIQHGVNFTYYEYHGSFFGIYALQNLPYGQWEPLPDDDFKNDQLFELFKTVLKYKTEPTGNIR